MEHRKYIDVMQDSAFKIVFTKVSNKGLIISLLNGLLNGMERVVDIEFGRNEQQGDTDEQGAVSYDVLCTGADGELFLLEIQRQSHAHFKERTVFYGSRLVNDQAPKDGIKDWGYRLKKVYVIAILDRFNIPGSPKTDYWHKICLCNTSNGDIFYDRLYYIYIELGKFVLKENELGTELEKWLYSLKHTGKMTSLPFYAREAAFKSYFSTVAYASLTKEEKHMIDFKLKNKWDYHMVMTEKYDEGKLEGELKGKLEGKIEGKIEGKLEGKIEGKIETAMAMKTEGFSSAQISKCTGLSTDEIEALISKAP